MFSPHLHSSLSEYWGGSQRGAVWKYHRSASSPFRDAGRFYLFVELRGLVFTFFHLSSGYRCGFISFCLLLCFCQVNPVITSPPFFSYALLRDTCRQLSKQGRMQHFHIDFPVQHVPARAAGDSHLRPSCRELSSVSGGDRRSELPDADTCSILERIKRQLQSLSHQLWHWQGTDCSQTWDNRN